MSPDKTELEIERSIERDIDWAIEYEHCSEQAITRIDLTQFEQLELIDEDEI